MAEHAEFCPIKQRLMDEFVHAVSEQHRLQSAQVRALLKGEGFPFEDQIAKAAEVKEQAKYAVLAHQQEHGC